MNFVQRNIITNIHENVKHKNFRSDDIVHELISYCEEVENMICDKNSGALIESNEVDFSRHLYLLVEDIETRQSNIVTDILEFTLDVITTIIMAVFDAIFLVLTTSVGLVVGELNIIVDVLNSISEDLSDLNSDINRARGLIETTKTSIETWSEILELDENAFPSEPNYNNRGLRLFKRQEEIDDLDKREKLAAVVQFAAFGYLSKGGDTLKSIQYSALAFAHLS